MHLRCVVGAPMEGVCQHVQRHIVTTAEGAKIGFQQHVPALAPLPLEHLHAAGA